MTINKKKKIKNSQLSITKIIIIKKDDFQNSLFKINVWHTSSNNNNNNKTHAFFLSVCTEVTVHYDATIMDRDTTVGTPLQKKKVFDELRDLCSL